MDSERRKSLRKQKEDVPEQRKKTPYRRSESKKWRKSTSDSLDQEPSTSSAMPPPIPDFSSVCIPRIEISDPSVRSSPPSQSTASTPQDTTQSSSSVWPETTPSAEYESSGDSIDSDVMDDDVTSARSTYTPIASAIIGSLGGIFEQTLGGHSSTAAFVAAEPFRLDPVPAQRKSRSPSEQRPPAASSAPAQRQHEATASASPPEPELEPQPSTSASGGGGGHEMALRPRTSGRLSRRFSFGASPEISDKLLKLRLAKEFLEATMVRRANRSGLADFIGKTHAATEVAYKSPRNGEYPVLTVDADRVPEDAAIRRMFGYVVRRRGGCTAAAHALCELRCAHCDVCSHMYECDCAFGREGWCCHIHAAVQGGRNIFDRSLAVFFHTTRRRMRLAHLRGSLYTVDDTIRVAHGTVFTVWSFGDLGSCSGEMFTVITVEEAPDAGMACRRCPAYKKCKLCDICRHSYRCECPQYEKEGLVCEHCHAIALLHGGKEAGHDYGYADDSANTDESSDEEQKFSFDADHLARFRRRLTAAHHERAYGISKRRYTKIVDPRGGPVHKYQIQSSRNASRVYTITPKSSYDSCAGHMDKFCQNACFDCGTCEYRFECNCRVNAEEICKHIHYIYLKEFRPVFDKSDLEPDETDLD